MGSSAQAEAFGMSFKGRHWQVRYLMFQISRMYEHQHAGTEGVGSLRRERVCDNCHLGAEEEEYFIIF